MNWVVSWPTATLSLANPKKSIGGAILRLKQSTHETAASGKSFSRTVKWIGWLPKVAERPWNLPIPFDGRCFTRGQSFGGSVMLKGMLSKIIGFVTFPSRIMHTITRRAKKQNAWPGEVFMVFVTDERIIYGWYWHECDPQESHLPMDYENRFREKLI